MIRPIPLHDRDKFYQNKYLNTIVNRKYKTVDVFWGSEGFVSESKISHKFFEKHDIENLNRIYVDSQHYLKPYIITLATKSYIDSQLNELLFQDSTNAWVFGGHVKVISLDDLESFFS